MASKKNEKNSNPVTKVAEKIMEAGKATVKEAKSLAESVLTHAPDKPKTAAKSKATSKPKAGAKPKAAAKPKAPAKGKK